MVSEDWETMSQDDGERTWVVQCRVKENWRALIVHNILKNNYVEQGIQYSCSSQSRPNRYKLFKYRYAEHKNMSKMGKDCLMKECLCKQILKYISWSATQ